MTASRCTLIALASVLCLAIATAINAQSATAPSQPQTQATPAAGTFPIGGVDVALPAPQTGFVEAGPEKRSLFQVFVPLGAQLVAAFASPQFLAALTPNQDISPASYALVLVPRVSENEDTSPDEFKAALGATIAPMGYSLDSIHAETDAEFNQRLQKLGLDKTGTKLEGTILLGCFFYQPDAIVIGLLTPANYESITVAGAMSMTILNVHKRTVFAYLYNNDYKDQNTVVGLRKASIDWTEAILAANK
jgi:hypothetical protein